MPGPTPKPPGRRQRRNRRGLEGVPTPAPVVPFRQKDVPDPPRGVLKTTRESWESFWQSEVAQFLDRDVDIPTVTRLHTLYDERERAYRAYQKKRMVVGSQGQPVINPMIRVVHDCDKEIRQLEDRLGKTMRSRAQIGMVMGAAAKSPEDLNRMMNADEDEGRQAQADPRKAKG